MAYRPMAFGYSGHAAERSGNGGSCKPQLTEAVDNFVSKWQAIPRKAARELRYDKTMKF